MREYEFLRQQLRLDYRDMMTGLAAVRDQVSNLEGIVTRLHEHVEQFIDKVQDHETRLQRLEKPGFDIA